MNSINTVVHTILQQISQNRPLLSESPERLGWVLGIEKMRCASFEVWIHAPGSGVVRLGFIFHRGKPNVFGAPLSR